LKASIAGALSGWQGLGSDDSREKPVDRVAAAGAVARRGPNQDRQGEQVARSNAEERTAVLCSLGVDLIAWKFGGRDTSGQDAIDMLAGILAWKTWGLKTTSGQRDKIAWWAATEWKLDSCVPCTGTGIHINALGVVGTCPACGGSKKRLYRDDERIEAMGEAFSQAMSKAHEILGWAESLALKRARAMLERW
jgi:hypothetical protein